MNNRMRLALSFTLGSILSSSFLTLSTVYMAKHDISPAILSSQSNIETDLKKSNKYARKWQRGTENYEDADIEQKTQEIYDKYGIVVVIDEESLNDFKDGTLNVISDLDKAFSEIYYPLRRETNTVRIASNIGNPTFFDDQSYSAFAYGSQRMFEVSSKKRYSTGIIAHELGHIKAHYDSDFRNKWIEAVNVDPTDELEVSILRNPEVVFPHAGFMTKYGSEPKYVDGINGRSIKGSYKVSTLTNQIPTWSEDYCEYLACFHQDKPDFKDCDPMDPRYLAKLMLLKEHEFISEEQFNNAYQEIDPNNFYGTQDPLALSAVSYIKTRFGYFPGQN